jgi:multiple sugar transport system permease protein
MKSSDVAVAVKLTAQSGARRHRRTRARAWFVAAMLSPAIVTLAALTLYPFVSNVYNSLFDWSLSKPNSRSFVLLGNYVDILFHNADFRHALWVSVCFTVGAVALELCLGMFIASLLNRIARRGLLLTLFILPMAATPIAITFVWRMMFSPSLGILNYFLSLLGLPASNWVANSSIVIPCLIVVDAWQWTPFVILVLLGGLLSMPVEPAEAAAMDGANAWEIFRHITLPLLEPFVVLVVLFRTIDAFKAFDLIFVMTTGGPGNASESLNIYTFRQGFWFLNMGYAAALAIIMLVIVIVISQMLLKRSRLQVGSQAKS